MDLIVTVCEESFGLLELDAESAHVLCHSLLALAGMSGRVVCPQEITLGADHWLVFSACIAIVYVT